MIKDNKYKGKLSGAFTKKEYVEITGRAWNTGEPMMSRAGYVRNDGPLWRYIDVIDVDCKRPYFLSEELSKILLTDDEVWKLGAKITNPNIECSESAQRLMRALGVHGFELK